MATHVPLSVLDLATVTAGSNAAVALRETTSLAVGAESWGYQRFWVAEHHAMAAVASSAPAVLIAHLANATASIRVGAGGVMLPNHAPLVIAEQFATLEALFAGRVDLGLGRAPGTDHVTARALRRSGDLHATSFPRDVVELLEYLVPHDDFVHPAPTPGAGYLPEVWLLGSSTFSAQLAGQLGLPFSFAYHFAPTMLDEALAAYRERFRPSDFLSRPHVMVAVSVVCAADDDNARWLSSSNALSFLERVRGRMGALPAPCDLSHVAMSEAEGAYLTETMSTHVIGSPSAVIAGLEGLVERTSADELLISTRVFDARARRDSYELLAQGWGLTSPSTRPLEEGDTRVS